jgi:hypothetical protein
VLVRFPALIMHAWVGQLSWLNRIWYHGLFNVVGAIVCSLYMPATPPELSCLSGSSGLGRIPLYLVAFFLFVSLFYSTFNDPPNDPTWSDVKAQQYPSPGEFPVVVESLEVMIDFEADEHKVPRCQSLSVLPGEYTPEIEADHLPVLPPISDRVSYYWIFGSLGTPGYVPQKGDRSLIHNLYARLLAKHESAEHNFVQLTTLLIDQFMSIPFYTFAFTRQGFDFHYVYYEGLKLKHRVFDAETIYEDIENNNLSRGTPFHTLQFDTTSPDVYQSSMEWLKNDWEEILLELNPCELSIRTSSLRFLRGLTRQRNRTDFFDLAVVHDIIEEWPLASEPDDLITNTLLREPMNVNEEDSPSWIQVWADNAVSFKKLRNYRAQDDVEFYEDLWSELPICDFDKVGMSLSDQALGSLAFHNLSWNEYIRTMGQVKWKTKIILKTDEMLYKNKPRPIGCMDTRYQATIGPTVLCLSERLKDRMPMWFDLDAPTFELTMSRINHDVPGLVSYDCVPIYYSWFCGITSTHFSMWVNRVEQCTEPAVFSGFLGDDNITFIIYPTLDQGLVVFRIEGDYRMYDQCQTFPLILLELFSMRILGMSNEVSRLLLNALSQPYYLYFDEEWPDRHDPSKTSSKVRLDTGPKRVTGGPETSLGGTLIGMHVNASWVANFLAQPQMTASEAMQYLEVEAPKLVEPWGLSIKWKVHRGFHGGEMLKFLILPCESYKLTSVNGIKLDCTLVTCPLPSRVLKLVKTLSEPRRDYGESNTERALLAFRNSVTGYRKECCAEPMRSLVNTYTLDRLIIGSPEQRNPYSIQGEGWSKKKTHMKNDVTMVPNHYWPYHDLSKVVLLDSAYDVLATRYDVPKSYFLDKSQSGPRALLSRIFGRHCSHELFISFIKDYNPEHLVFRNG